MGKYIVTLAAAATGIFVWQLMAQRAERMPTPRAQKILADSSSANAAVVGRPAASAPAGAAPSSVEIKLGTDPGLSTFVDRKYSYLSTKALSSELRAALEHREALAVRLNTERQARVPAPESLVERTLHELLRADERISYLMHPSEYAEYLLLRDANAELFHLHEYAGGIHNLLPLTHEHERAILFAKLTYKQQYEHTLSESGVESTDLPVWQRLHAYERVAEAAREHRYLFLQQARQSLPSEDMFALLSNYEHTELDRELARLHRAAVSQ